MDSVLLHRDNSFADMYTRSYLLVYLGASLLVNSSFFKSVFPSLIGHLISLCYKLNVCISPNSYTDALTPSLMVLGNGDFGRYLGLDKVTRMETSC